MKCPIDGSPLSVSSREGVEIDFCPQCRGVWLDRGELDKIIERTAATGGAASPAVTPYAEAIRPVVRDDRLGDQRKRKRRSFLEDLFDFD
jgi:Zn-finger nucleic acid-binding protein